MIGTVFCAAVLLYALIVDTGKKSEPYQEHAQDFCVYLASFSGHTPFCRLCPVTIFDVILIAFLANHNSTLKHTMHATWQALVLLMLNYSCYIVATLVYFTTYP